MSNPPRHMRLFELMRQTALGHQAATSSDQRQNAAEDWKTLKIQALRSLEP
ncbi:hypothetical protein [uncultured Tateyamaria sp.]|uniref:hypothetical protein n=1 Tax=uncultured Tateyamaria sp. TaxID=455651 RepID=UPI00262FA4BD|nr:hypothetical protein [uncultured Tateyamaria sp.]